MLKHWLIRSFFIVPLLLCIFGWTFSVSHVALIRYTHAGTDYSISTRCGTVEALWENCWDRPIDGWSGSVCISTPDSHVLPTPLFIFESRPPVPGTTLCRLTILGFAFHDWTGGRSFLRQLLVPYWFLILLLAFGLIVSWKKTKPKPDSKTAFPVKVEGPA